MVFERNLWHEVTKVRGTFDHGPKRLGVGLQFLRRYLFRKMGGVYREDLEKKKRTTARKGALFI